MKQLPDNWGQCFDAAGLTMVNFPRRAKLCHGLGIANAPGEEGNVIKHAWIEMDGLAYDCVWGVTQSAEAYRNNLQISYVVEYTQAEMWENWLRTDTPGPWDAKIASSGIIMVKIPESCEVE